ncbi:MAG: protein kinase [Sandaracinaceae bacterium]
MPRRRLPLDDVPTRDIGPYKMAHRIAVGGMAEVYRALWPQQAGGDRAVVIKRMLPMLLEDPEQREMFAREAALGANIDHPNVVAVIDHGVDDGAPYLVLEYVFGVDLFRLTRYVRRLGRPLRVPLAVWIGCELLRGLEAVHEVRDPTGARLNVVHRDVSPSNVFLSVHGDVKLGDLGIARDAPETPARQKGGFRAKGKLGYLPPEQVAGQEVDQRGDVFSAAVVIAELLLGKPLYAGGTEIGVLLAIRDGDTSAFRAIVPSLPDGLGDAVLAGLTPRPEDRVPSARALHALLAPYVDAPGKALQEELGQLVVTALDGEGVSADRTSLARTIERDADWYEAQTPVAPPEETLRESGVAYLVEREGARLGVYRLAELVAAITTAEVRATDVVHLDDLAQGGAPRAVAAVPELARYLPASTRTPSARRRTQMAETNELYELSGRSFLAILLESLRAKDDGLLLCEDGGVRKEVYLEQGVPVFVTSNRPEELLGEFLVKRGVLERHELDIALATMPRFEGRLGETLVALGLVDAVQVFRHISEQVRDKLLDLFLWKRGHVALYRDVHRPERAFPLQLDPWEVFETGALRRVEAGLEDASLGRDLVLVATKVDPSDCGASESLCALWTACAVPRGLSELEGIAASPARARAGVVLLLELGALERRSYGEGR